MTLFAALGLPRRPARQAPPLRLWAPLPWAIGEDGSVRDATGAPVLTVDPERARPDSAVRAIQRLIVETVNARAHGAGAPVQPSEEYRP